MKGEGKFLKALQQLRGQTSVVEQHHFYAAPAPGKNLIRLRVKI
jgi:hypothetical protein